MNITNEFLNYEGLQEYNEKVKRYIEEKTPQSDWAQTDSTKADFIKNKPELGNIASKDEVSKTDLSADVQASLDKADSALQSFSETDPTVPAWAKASTKPAYTASEVGAVPTSRTINGKALSENITLSASDVGALSSATDIPDTLADLTSDSSHRTVTDAEKATWNAKSNFSGSYNDLTNKPTIPSISGLATETYVDDIASTKVDKVSGKGLSTNDYTTTEKNKLSGIASGAEVNQNAFSNVVVGSTTIAADSKTDSLTIAAGTGISVSGDATNDKVTISNSGVRSISTGSANGTISVNTNGTSADVPVKGLGSAAYTNSSAYDAAGTAQTKADSALSSAKSYTDTKISNLINSAPTTLDTLGEIAAAMEENADVVDALEDAIGTKANASDLTSHTGNKSNPHGVTKAQVGLGNVENKSSATIRGELTKANVTTALGYTPPTTNTTYDAAGSSLGLVKSGGDVTISSGVITVNDDSHNHVISNVDGLQTALDGKAPSSHNHAASNITSGTLSSDRLPTVPIAKGGTGATTAAGALTNLGITATAAELNKMDGVTATTTELNYVDGVKSSIQTQLDGKASSSHTHNYAGSSSAGGSATSAVKLQTARSIGLENDLTGSANFDGSGNITISAKHYNANVDSGNKNNYPYHRFAYRGSKAFPITSSYIDMDAIFCIRGTYDDGGYGILKVSLRTNDPTTASKASATWLARYKFALDDVKIGLYNVAGATYADLYIKVGTYARTVVYQLEGNRSWTLVSSHEVNNTTTTDAKTSTECYVSIETAATKLHSQAYTSIISSVDGGQVNYANSATKATQDASGNTITSTYATKTELNTAKSSLQTSIDGKANSSHTHNYAGSSSAGGAATSANKLNTNAGSATQPVYFANGIPVKTTYTLGKSVPSDAKFTDTTYSAASQSAAGLMSAADKKKLDGIASGATANTGDITGVTAGAGLGGGGTSGTVTLTNSGVRSITQDSTDGHKLTINTGGTSTTITIPDSNTTYSAATTSAQGLMSAADKKKLDGITESADSVSVSRSLTSGTKVGTITINGTGTDLYAPTNTDTHYTTKIYAGLPSTTTNSVCDSPYIKITDDNTYRNQIRLVAGSATSIKSDTNGNITISSADTTYPIYKMGMNALAIGDIYLDYNFDHAGDSSFMVNHGSVSYNEDMSSTTHTQGYPRDAFAANSSVAGGDYAFACGRDSSAYGENSFAAGYSNCVASYNSAAFGEGNYVESPNALFCGTWSAYQNTGYFVVGKGGSEAARSNAFRVTSAGKCMGTSSFVASGADYAEYYEWIDGNPDNEDRRGYFVTLDGTKIRMAMTDDDYILGVISGAPAVIGNGYTDEWNGMYLKDIFGEYLTETVEVEETTDKNGVVIPAHTETRLVLNPEYDNTQKYIGRDQRKEWSPVGTHGQLVVIDDGTCEVNGYCKVVDGGTATKADDKTEYRVTERLDDTHIRITIK